MAQKRVAIIGAGISGLLSAKYSVINGLVPVVFEKTSEIGGLWTANVTAIYPGMTTNVTKYVSTLSDHSWPANTPIYPAAQQVCDYFRSYAQKFDLNKHIRFRHQVEYVQRLSDHSWSVKFKNLSTNEVTTEIFEFLIIASGIFSSPKTPRLDHLNMSAYRGTIKHSSQFRKNDPDLECAKNILVVGGSISAVDIAGVLASSNKHITHLFRRKVAVVSRLWREKIAEPNLYTIQPLEFFSYPRSNGFVDASSSLSVPKQDESKKKSELKKFFPFQQQATSCCKSACPEALRIDFDRTSEEIIIGQSDAYIDAVRDGIIHAIQSEVERFDENGVYLKSGDYVKTDAVIYCTGFNASLDYLDRQVLEALKFRADMPRFAVLLFKNTFVPEWETMAFIGHYPRLNFVGYELQAMWACRVFSGKCELPELGVMHEYVRGLEEKRNKDLGAQFPYGPYFKLADDIARELGLMPDLTAIRQTNPKVFDYLANDVVTWAHYLFDKQDRDYFMNLFREVREYKLKVYELNRSEQDLRHSDLLENFCKFFKY